MQAHRVTWDNSVGLRLWSLCPSLWATVHLCKERSFRARRSHRCRRSQRAGWVRSPPRTAAGRRPSAATDCWSRPGAGSRPGHRTLHWSSSAGYKCHGHLDHSGGERGREGGNKVNDMPVEAGVLSFPQVSPLSGGNIKEERGTLLL